MFNFEIEGNVIDIRNVYMCTKEKWENTHNKREKKKLNIQICIQSFNYSANQ